MLLEPERPPVEQQSSSNTKTPVSTSDRLREMLKEKHSKSHRKHSRRHSRSKSSSPSLRELLHKRSRSRSRKGTKSPLNNGYGGRSEKSREPKRREEKHASKGLHVDLDLDDLEAELSKFKAEKKAQVLATNHDVKRKTFG